MLATAPFETDAVGVDLEGLLPPWLCKHTKGSSQTIKSCCCALSFPVNLLLLKRLNVVAPLRHVGPTHVGASERIVHLLHRGASLSGTLVMCAQPGTDSEQQATALGATGSGA